MRKITKLWAAFAALFCHKKIISQARIEEVYKHAITASCESDDGQQCSTLNFPAGCTVEELMLVAEYCKAKGNHVRVFHEIGWDEYSDEQKAYYLRIEFRAQPFPPAVLFPFLRRLTSSSYYLAV